MATIIDIAEAVTNELNGGSFSQPFTVQRHYRPSFELKDMAVLHVTVVPAAMEIQTLGRNLMQQDYRIDVAVQQKLDAGDNAEIDPLMSLVEEIADFFRLRPLSNQTAICVKVENAPVYAAEHLDQLRQFTSVLTLTFRILR